MPAMMVEGVQVVRGPDGRVVVIFWGEDADAEAADWTAQGYRVDTVAHRCLEG
jgi:hypothetical protein